MFNYLNQNFQKKNSVFILYKVLLNSILILINSKLKMYMYFLKNVLYFLKDR